VFLTLLQSRSAPPPPPPTPVIDGGGSSAKRSRKGWGRERAIYEASLLKELDSKTSSIAELEQIRQALAKHTESQRLARKLVNYDGDLEELASLQKELAKLQVTYKNKAEQRLSKKCRKRQEKVR